MLILSGKLSFGIGSKSPPGGQRALSCRNAKCLRRKPGNLHSGINGRYNCFCLFNMNNNQMTMELSHRRIYFKLSKYEVSLKQNMFLNVVFLHICSSLSIFNFIIMHLDFLQVAAQIVRTVIIDNAHVSHLRLIV